MVAVRHVNSEPRREGSSAKFAEALLVVVEAITAKNPFENHIATTTAMEIIDAENERPLFGLENHFVGVACVRAKPDPFC